MLTPDQVQPEAFRPLKRSEYDRLVELGAFEDEHLELLRGAIIEMSPQEALHAAVIRKLTRIFLEGLGRRAEVLVQAPLALSEDSEPEPDLAVVPPGDYWASHPTTAWLVIEVAESSLRKDRTVKSELYAQAGIAEYWIVNLADRTVEVHTAPTQAGYGQREVVPISGRATFQLFPDVTVDVGAIFP